VRAILFPSFLRDTGMDIYSKFLEGIAKSNRTHTQKAQILGATVQNVLVRKTRNMRFSLQCL